MFGVFSTSFVSNEIGDKKPQIIDIETRENRVSYDKLKTQYFVLNRILTQITVTDREFMASSQDEFFIMSTKYQDYLPQIDKALPGAKALTVETKYGSIKKQVETVYNDIAVFLQKMGAGLANKDLKSYEEAITWRDKAFYDFDQLRLNMIEFSKIVKVDPEVFMEDLPDLFPLVLPTK